MKNNIKLYVGLAAIALMASCKPEIVKEYETSNPQNVNFSKYIAVGNSLTAGFADGGLYLEGQQVAFPGLLAEQMKSYGGGSFETPFFSEAQSNGSGYLRLKSLENGRPVTESVTDKLAYTGAGVLAKYSGGEINNLGVPGMRLDHSGVALVSAGNMYFSRLLPDAEVGKKSYQDFVENRSHTFFSFWLGNNDVLGYATNGAVNDNPAGTTVLTNEQTFKAVYTQFIGKLTANGQKGVVATIPDVTTIPYFTTVTRKALLDAASAIAGQQIPALVIATKSGPRVATDNDLFILPFSSLAPSLLGKPNALQAPYGFHTANPIEDKYVLDAEEAANIKVHIEKLNAIIKQIATDKNLALADANAYLTRIKNGMLYNGFGISSAYITGNVFSLDGIHLTPIGNAIMSNLVIDAINAKYGTKLEKVDASKFRGIKMP
ncbi:SGNH/GDSL hydrolase family protein [Sphingobacterium bovistauri]|uniref:G-D-S-L family lipolytic protein n=1 Tax=Sphingobacterium bovistauri TaxID=2781959 RepID=A0ABS7Z176_9SPHI|nr:SGNH/GDSL hydrolase family protein [Sphingobacterium bovistauri]MCA5003919.1 G-D-S-L family lipolytic protein [Sphingobacterium bovistauri]